MRTILAILPLLLVACVTDDYRAGNGTNYVAHSRKQFGGVSSYSRSDGSSGADDMQQSARDFFNFAGTAITAGAGAYVNHGKNAADALTVQQAQQGATAVELGAQKTAVELAKIPK